MRATATTRAAHTSTIRTALVGAVALLATVGLSGVAGAAMPDPEPYDPTSDAGVTPSEHSSSQGGGDLKCLDLDEDFTGTAHVEGEAIVPVAAVTTVAHEDGHEEESFPEWLSFEVDGSTVSWSSDYPISAVILKGGPKSHAYVYGPARLSDGGLITPQNNSGKPADISSIRFCWEGDPDQPDLTALCEAAAASAGVGAIVSAVGPMSIVDGVVDMSTVPAGVELTFDLATEMVGFSAPFPVVTAVTQASEPVTHMIDPPSLTGNVPLSSNPGDGDVVLCGLAVPVPVETSCDALPNTTLLGPVMISGGMVDGDGLPSGITSVVPNSTSIDFTASVPVEGVVVIASPPELYSFPSALLVGSVPATIDGEGDVELVFCTTTISDDPSGDQSTDDPVDPTATDTTDDTLLQGMGDPTTIPTGGGPSGRTALALIAFVVLALAGSTTLLVWSRAG